ncbi:hypothetical protein [Salibacter halophilus]|uniref:Uncharacterized protein n=1 Tax=Salibacter halophilus TaxID=1803916 RepID=A0A6N6M200_9FLAO|nr:hypothetical protein [Salibacter halophilus]KAB1062669.1 hypothetical protein F3059_12035 [Salibacter halophilus]
MTNGNWDVFGYEEAGKYIAYLPLEVKSKYGIKMAISPQMTTLNGLVYDLPQNLTNSKLYSKKRKIIENISYQLKEFHYVNFCVDEEYWLPFKWNEFNVKPINMFSLNTHEPQQYHKSHKSLIKKSTEHHKIVDTDFETFTSLNEASFLNQGANLPYEKNRLKNALNKVGNEHSVLIKGIENEKKDIVATALFLEDHLKVYFLASGINKEHSIAGDQVQLIDFGIKGAVNKQKEFCFYGSNKPSIAKFFERFSPVPETYWNIVWTRGKGKLIDIKNQIS